ncbi:MAG TPA: hypothetical protein ENJ18_07605 [Nannocystis exedens]|nr:hypothetical protein [Nannocystis exedens]
MSIALAAAIWWALRLGALLSVQVPWLRLLGALWIPIALVLAFAIAGALALSPGSSPLIASAQSIEPVVFLKGALLEILFGGLSGLVIGLPGHALLGAANASQRALEIRRGALEPLLIALVLSLCLGLGLDAPLLLGLREFALLMPPGLALAGSLDLLSGDVLGPEIIAKTCAQLLFLALALATPVLLTRAVIELAASLVEPPGNPRAGLARWLASAAAVIALSASWAAYPTAWLQAVEPASVELPADRS